MHNIYPKVPISRKQNEGKVLRLKKMKTIRCDIISVRDFNSKAASRYLRVISEDDVVDEGDRFVLKNDQSKNLSYYSPVVRETIGSLQSQCINKKSDKDPVTIHTEVWVDGLDLPIPVSYNTGGSLSVHKLDKFAHSVLSNLVEAASAEKVLSFLRGDPGKDIPKGQIVFRPFDGDDVGSYDSHSNKINVEFEADKLIVELDKKKTTVCSDTANTVFHEFVHALVNLKIIDVDAVAEHYQDLLRSAFPEKSDYDRYIYVKELAYSSDSTPEILEEYWFVMVPRINASFLYYHAAFSPGEYLSVSAAAYLNKNKCGDRNDRVSLKAIDPVGYDILSAIFRGVNFK